MDNFKKILELDGSTPEPEILSGDTGQRIPCFDSCQLITTLMCNMCAIIIAQYQFSCSPKLARKCEIEHWWPCGADGRAGGVRSPYGAPPAHPKRTCSSAKNENASMVLLQNTLMHAASCLVIGWVQSHQTRLGRKILKTIFSTIFSMQPFAVIDWNKIQD